MSMKIKWITVYALIGVLIAGILSGGFMGNSWRTPPEQTQTPDIMGIPSPDSDRGHNHLGLWLAIIAIYGAFLGDWGVMRKFGVAPK